MDQPIACVLRPAEFRGRIDDLSALAARALRSREPTADGERLIFTDSEGTERDLRAAIAAESRCCAFLRMELRRADEGLVLDVAGPPEARPIIAGMFAVSR